uniref:FLYWCH-type domain-containing protein n=1 Tax=Ornithodoros turicata TaxID=34597 RepID=A0A2R5L4T5_9ACAR
MEFITSNKGREKMCVDGYVYTKHKAVVSGVRWRCVRRMKGCKGALICETTGKLRVSVAHIHPPNASDINVAKARSTMRELAMSTTENPAAIVARAVSRLTPEEKVSLKREESLKRCIRAQRSSVYAPPVYTQHHDSENL